MSGHRKFWGLKCRWCGRPVKELAACDLTFEGKTVAVNLCLKCLRKLGLKEELKFDEDGNVKPDFERSTLIPR